MGSNANRIVQCKTNTENLFLYSGATAFANKCYQEMIKVGVCVPYAMKAKAIFRSLRPKTVTFTRYEGWSGYV